MIYNAGQVKGNAIPIVVIGIGLSLLVYRKFTQVLWGASFNEPTPAVHADVHL